MRPVRQRPKFRCDFCNKTGTRASMEAHEPICWKNPDRFCDLCQNTGEVTEGAPGYRILVPCLYCSQFEPTPDKRHR